MRPSATQTRLISTIAPKDLKAHVMIYEAYKPLFTNLKQDDPSIGLSVPLPKFPLSVLFQLTSFAEDYFKKQPTVLDLEPEITLVGDVHGNIRDLLKVLSANHPETCKILFLGDYVDRGPFSIEVISLLFSLVLMFPQNVYLLRGNHEFPLLNLVYGFAKEVQQVYKTPALCEAFQQVFTYLPLAAVVGKTIFCIHAGLGPSFQHVEQLRTIKKPIVKCKGIVSDVLWSDPGNVMRFATNVVRGVGYLFGEQVTEQFLARNGLSVIIRGHECVQNGYETAHGMKVMTVFSSSNYTPGQDNYCGYLTARSDNRIEAFRLPRIPPLSREQALFEERGEEIENGVRKRGSAFQVSAMNSFYFAAPYVPPSVGRLATRKQPMVV